MLSLNLYAYYILSLGAVYAYTYVPILNSTFITSVKIRWLIIKIVVPHSLQTATLYYYNVNIIIKIKYDFKIKITLDRCNVT